MIPVEQIFYPHDYSITWYPITGFPGYEATIIPSGQLFVRSLKQFKKFPFGDLIYPNNSVYQMSNYNNQRVNVSINEVVENMDKDNGRPTDRIERFKARNKRMGIMCVDSPDVGKVVKNPKPLRRKQDKEYFMPKFTIIKENDDIEK